MAQRAESDHAARCRGLGVRVGGAELTPAGAHQHRRRTMMRLQAGRREEVDEDLSAVERAHVCVTGGRGSGGLATATPAVQRQSHLFLILGRPPVPGLPDSRYSLDLLAEDRFRQEGSDHPVGNVDHLVDSQVDRHRGDRVGLLAVAPITLDDVIDDRARGLAGGLEQVGMNPGADVVARALGGGQLALPAGGTGDSAERCRAAPSAAPLCPWLSRRRFRRPRRHPSPRACRPPRRGRPAHRPGAATSSRGAGA